MNIMLLEITTLYSHLQLHVAKSAAQIETDSASVIFNQRDQVGYTEPLVLVKYPKALKANHGVALVGHFTVSSYASCLSLSQCSQNCLKSCMKLYCICSAKRGSKALGSTASSSDSFSGLKCWILPTLHQLTIEPAQRQATILVSVAHTI